MTERFHSSRAKKLNECHCQPKVYHFTLALTNEHVFTSIGKKEKNFIEESIKLEGGISNI